MHRKNPSLGVNSNSLQGLKRPSASTARANPFQKSKLPFSEKPSSRNEQPTDIIGRIGCQCDVSRWFLQRRLCQSCVQARVSLFLPLPKPTWQSVWWTQTL